MLEKNILQGNKGENLFFNLCKRDGYDIRKANRLGRLNQELSIAKIT